MTESLFEDGEVSLKIPVGVFSEKLQADNSRSTKEAPTWTLQVEGHFFQEEDREWYRDCRRSCKCDRTFRFEDVEPV